ncbi:MAG: CDP-glucose 4,6-dehydratase, partial [Rhodocyclaceae bacterium]|nr:CDP-glucose 4,6-dehydratase [Rhodocyclaceae bacterium]
SFLFDRVKIATARAGNVIGGGDWAADRLVPDALKAWQTNQPVMVRYPQAVRPWQHVLEPLAGYLLLAQRLHEGQCAGAWNFGPSESDFLSVAELLNRLSHHWGSGSSWKYEAGDHPAEAGLLRIDSSKARHELGWNARFNADKALSMVVDWHRAWVAGQDMREFSLNQIDRYHDGESP